MLSRRSPVRPSMALSLVGPSGAPRAVHERRGCAGLGFWADAFERLPEPLYDFNPNGWMLFRVRESGLLGGSEYVAVRSETLPGTARGVASPLG
jgi:hypothetical protein